MTASVREQLRQQVDQARRRELKLAKPCKYSSEHGYAKGCRCEQCRLAARLGRRKRKKTETRAWADRNVTR
jgi:hypothetical protein